MAYIAKDGKRFPTTMQGRKYDDWLVQKDKAPGGTSQQQALKDNGPVRSITMTREGMGRHRLSVEHFNGTKSTEVHPEAFRAHQVMAAYLGIDTPPPAIQTHQRARSQPTGPKEAENLREQDHRNPESTEDDNV